MVIVWLCIHYNIRKPDDNQKEKLKDSFLTSLLAPKSAMNQVGSVNKPAASPEHSWCLYSSEYLRSWYSSERRGEPSKRLGEGN